MTASKFNKYWTLITILLVAVVAISSTVACTRYSRSQRIEISLPPTQELQGDIYVGGAVSNPGFYSLRAGDTIEALIQAAGGTTGNADLSWFKLYIPRTEEEEPPQKIDLNRAGAWLLEALPGVGETIAQAIIDYREKNGLFRNVNELIKVEGIGTATYDKIKDQVTIAD